MDFVDELIISKFQNIGLFKNIVIYVKDYRYNKNILHIVVNDIEYAIRVSDASYIKVCEV